MRSCHPAPFYLDNLMHDLKVEDFVAESPSGPIKTFTLRGIKDSPPYLHDGRCLTLEDTVEFFNLVLGTKLTKEEKSDLVAFMRQLDAQKRVHARHGAPLARKTIGPSVRQPDKRHCPVIDPPEPEVEHIQDVVLMKFPRPL